MFLLNAESAVEHLTALSLSPGFVFSFLSTCLIVLNVGGDTEHAETVTESSSGDTHVDSDILNSPGYLGSFLFSSKILVFWFLRLVRENKASRR